MTPRAHTPKLSVAPMMERTDRHFRRMMRAITRHTLLYTEMVTTAAVLNGGRRDLLAFSPVEHPISLQLGGDDAAALTECAVMAEELGYDEVNINVGCPSSRVQAGCFGVALMGQPGKVADAVHQMRARVDIPVTVKHRIGFDEIDHYDHMLAFVDRVSEAASDRFTVHARKAWLKGLSPKENRNVPPLRHAEVWRLKAERPELEIEINGGITTLEAVEHHLQHVDGVMIGRGAYDHPMRFAEADTRIFGQDSNPLDAVPDPLDARAEVVRQMAEYARSLTGERDRPAHVARHMLNLYAGIPGARRWRRTITEGLARKGPVDQLLIEALEIFAPGRAAG